MKKSVFVRIAAAVMAIVLCLCSMGALAGCTKTRSINVLVYGQYIDLDVISNFKKRTASKSMSMSATLLRSFITKRSTATSRMTSSAPRII